MQYLVPAVVHKLQDEALANAKIRRAEEADLLIQEFQCTCDINKDNSQ
jgi:hypothetical protein